VKHNIDPTIRRFAPLVAVAIAVGATGCGGGNSAAPRPAPANVSSPAPPEASTRAQAVPSAVATQIGKKASVEVTYYAAYDNDPSGTREIANPTPARPLAGGTGTYANPLTFASPEGKGEYPFGTIIYVPQDKKYYERDDTCGVSWTAEDGCGDVSHVDLYMDDNAAPKDSRVTDCEDARTPDGMATIILNPPANLPVDSSIIWNAQTLSCAAVYK
jgi:hypothetical protein